MNKPLFTGCIAALLLVSGCSDSKETEKAAEQTATQQVEESAPVETAGGIYGVDDTSLAKTAEDPHAGVTMPQQSAGGNAHTGTVVETMDAGGYTYVNVNADGETYWIAGPKTPVTAGQSISYMEQMWMHDFHSKSLDKNFDKIMFVTTIVPAGAKPESGSAPVAPVAKAEGGYSVAEVYAQKADLSGKRIDVKGKVVKLSRGIMGKDWVHIQDGTGEAGSNDLVVTSPSADVSEGETVTATGVVKTDVDLGYGYTYAVLVEEASFTK